MLALIATSIDRLIIHSSSLYELEEDNDKFAMMGGRSLVAGIRTCPLPI